MSIQIQIKADTNLELLTSGDYEYDLMINGLGASIRELQLPGYNGIPMGALFMDGPLTYEALEELERLPWVAGVAFSEQEFRGSDALMMVDQRHLEVAIHKDADPTEDARDDLTLEEAHEIVYFSGAPDLIWIVVD